ncbi:MAG: lysozyme inhibitor LprI family protein [Candidatus Binatia bacterium]
MTISKAQILRHLLLVAVAVLLAVLPLFAQDAVDPKTLDCRGWTSKVMSQAEMNICARRDSEMQRQTLERLVGDLRSKLAARQPEQWARLEANQRKWGEFVDHDCKWEAAFADGGSIQPLVHARCVARATAQRISRLRIVLCEGEGMTGECPESRKYEENAEQGAPPAAHKDPRR